MRTTHRHITAHHRPRTRLRRARTAVLAVVTASLLATACSSADSSEDSGTSGKSSGAYPLTLESPFKTQTLDKKPERVAVVSSGDLDIALALGVEPVIIESRGGAPFDPWTKKRMDALGIDKLKSYDSTDSIDFAAIAEAKPDVILATNAWTLPDDFEMLSKVAPVVAHTTDKVGGMSWQDRVLLAGKALDRQDQAKKEVADVEKAFGAAREKHPEFKGKTLTYAVMHPNQITYMSHQEWDAGFFLDLGFTRPKNAAKFKVGKEAVSVENIDLLDADVLVVGYPFGDEGVITREKLEKDRLFTKLEAVKGDNYLVMDNQAASPLAYPSVLSQPWLLDHMLPRLDKTVS